MTSKRKKLKVTHRTGSANLDWIAILFILLKFWEMLFLFKVFGEPLNDPANPPLTFTPQMESPFKLFGKDQYKISSSSGSKGWGKKIIKTMISKISLLNSSTTFTKLEIRKKKKRVILTLISLNGMSKLFSSFESNPKRRAASLKFRLVATNAFMVGLGTV